MTASLRSLVRCRSGTTAIEFGAAALPLLLMIFGTIEFGRLMWTRTALQSVATATARCMGLVQSQCGSAGTYSASMTAAYTQTLATAATVKIPASGVVLNANTSCGGVSGFSQVSITATFNTVAPSLLSSITAIPLTAMACFPNQS